MPVAAVAAAAGAVAPLPSAAEAATVSVRPNTKPVLLLGGPPMELVYVAGAGERNRTVVQAGSPWTVTDAGAVIEAGEGCTAVDAHTAHCQASVPGDYWSPQLLVADVQAGDLDDEVTLLQPPPPAGLLTALGATFPMYADGGAGNDNLSAERSDGALDGGPGDDRLHGAKALDGGGGRDELGGVDRDETFSDGDLDGATGDAAPGPDLIDAGPGADTVSYRQRTSPVFVSLGEERAGAAGEGDAVRGVESIIGGQGEDVLQGDDGPNVIDGRRGRDTLIGGAGDDQFVNGRGPIACGDGTDRVISPRASDSLGRGCEQVAVEFDPEDVFSAYPFRRRARAVWFGIHCPLRAREDLPGRYRCTGRVTITEAAGQRRRLAEGTSRPGRWAYRAVKLPLTRVGRRLATSRRVVPAVISLTIEPSYLPTLRWRIRF